MQTVDNLKINSREDALTPSQPEPVKKSGRTSSPLFIVPPEASAGNHRGSETLGVVLARVYRIVLEGARGQP